MKNLVFYSLFIIIFPLTKTKAQGIVDEDRIIIGLKEHDHALYIKDGWIRDPYIYLAPDGNYYLTGTTPNPNDPRESIQPYNTGLDMPELTGSDQPSIVGAGIQLWRSHDLVKWEYLGMPYTLKMGYWSQVMPENFESVPETEWKLWAPEVYFINNQWIFVHTSPSPINGGANLAISEQKSLNGQFTHPLEENMRWKHDPSLFIDSDSSVYLLWGNTWIVPINESFTGFSSKPVRIDPSGSRQGPDGNPISIIGHEGATLRKIGNKYVHFGTAWSTDQGRKGTYNLYYCTSDNILGPYGPRKFAGRFLGHGTPFRDKEGKWWCTAFYNANVPPISNEESQQPSVANNAYTINEQGVTIVPLEVIILDNDDVYIRAKDPAYAMPGPEETQSF
jgi:xylan 1,4-beta-xylosidase